MGLSIVAALLVAAIVGIVLYHRNDPIPSTWISPGQSATFNGSEFTFVELTEMTPPEDAITEIPAGAAYAVLVVEQQVLEAPDNIDDMYCTATLRTSEHEWLNHSSVSADFDGVRMCGMRIDGEPLGEGEVNTITFGWIVPDGTVDDAHVVMTFPGARQSIGMRYP